MKLYFKIGIVLILALLAWLLLQGKTETTTIINTVSLQTSPVKSQAKPEAINKNEIKKPQVLVNSEISEEEKARLAKELKQLSYIQMYDMSEDLYDCFGYLERLDLQNNRFYKSVEENKPLDFMQEYSQKIQQFSNYRQQQATDKQLNYYQGHFENCEAMVNKVKSLYNAEEEKADNLFYVQTRLKSLMQETQAKSDEGEILKLTIENVKRLKTSLNELEKFKKGKPTVSQEELWKIEGEIEKLRWEVAGLKQVPEEERDEQNLKIQEEEYKQKKIYLASLFEHDEQAFTNKVAEFHSLIEETEKSLHTKYPRVFYEAFAGVNFSFKDNNKLPDYYARERYKDLGVEFSILSEQIKNQISIKDDAYFNQLLQPALDLYLCYLGQDCQLPVNRHLANYCYIPQMGFSNSSTGLYFEACDVDLQEFYLEHYLTENQVEDLNLIFDYLVENYAK